MSGDMFRIGLVGAISVGLAVARRLAEPRPVETVSVVDKEADVVVHRTGHHRGAVHADLCYPRGR